MAHDGSLIRLEIVTQKGIALAEDVEEVIAPAVGGSFGVLPGHLPLLAALDVGVLHYRKGGKLVDVAIANGFVEVLDDRAVILTDRFALHDDVDVLAVRERLKEVDEELEAWEGELAAPERLALVEEEQWLAAELELIGDPPRSHVLEPSRQVDYTGLFPGEAPAGEGALGPEDAGADEAPAEEDEKD
ncbi:MAG: ATP synthase F1 subunit epsilon [Polyangiaceae bacterium]|nr:ATP synthase F1 subunit epsilon [Polyangiaceae bacterium]